MLANNERDGDQAKNGLHSRDQSGEEADISSATITQPDLEIYLDRVD